MRGLMEDLVNFNTITKTNEELKVVDLNKIVEETIADLSATIKSNNGVITKDNLPTIEGYEHQLKILFDNLVDNALKFSKPDERPIITIASRIEKGSVVEPGNESIAEKDFYSIAVSDNGIGFEKNFAHKIFMLFQRLHAQNSEYAGKGVGLAICKRVMINHNGYITATGSPNNGATFTVYFPIKTGFESN
jgi:light-regulated signal transduction histidine kinase (bacteriophytochrome)